MLSIELFDSKYERRLHEGAVDDLEHRRIEDLNRRMDDLMARAKSAGPEAKAALKAEFEKVKAERDSYYKIRETQRGTDVVDVKQKMKALTPAKPGMVGAVKDVAQGLKNFLQGKPETGPTYEDQKKSLDNPPSSIRDTLQKYLQVDGETDVEAVKAAIQKIGRDQGLRPMARARLLGQVGMIIKKHRLPVGPTYYQYMQRFMEDDSSTSSDAAERAILNRIMVAHTDLLQQYGPQKVMQAVEEVAYNVGDVEEIGSSDVSGWVRQVEQILGASQELDEKCSAKYKRSINCNNPKGFSQRAHCQGRKK